MYFFLKFVVYVYVHFCFLLTIEEVSRCSGRNENVFMSFLLQGHDIRGKVVVKQQKILLFVALDL